SNPKKLRRFFMAILIFASVVHLEVYRVLLHSHSKIYDVLGNNYLITGQTLGCGFIILIVSSLHLLRQGERGIYWGLILLCGTFFYIQLSLGGRGTVIVAGVVVLDY